MEDSVTIQFQPQPDITAYELAMIFGSFKLVVQHAVLESYTLPLLYSTIQCKREVWEGLDPNVRRHLHQVT